MAGAVMVFIYAGTFVLPAQAAPATLKSPDATIYEQADEGSSAVGSLVEGSAFEYIGDVTAEDGSVWHQVTTAGGTVGYIKGDREMEVGEGAPAPEGEGGPEEGQGNPEGQAAPEGQDNPEAQAAPEGQDNPGGQTAPEGEGGNGDAASARDEPGNGEAGVGGVEAGQGNPEGGREEGTEDPEGAGGEGAEDGQPGEGSPEDGEVTAGGYSAQNNRAKSYSLDSSGRIKGKESIVPTMNMGTEGIKDRRAGVRVDLTVLLAVAVTFSSAGAMHLCWGRIKRARAGERQPLDRGKGRLYRRNEKKKHSQKRKGRKK